MLTAISHVEQIVHQLTFGDRHYGVTFAQDRIGVVRNGCGKVKYMPVTLGLPHTLFPPTAQDKAAL